jgi:hypothetical protein
MDTKPYNNIAAAAVGYDDDNVTVVHILYYVYKYTIIYIIWYTIYYLHLYDGILLKLLK